MHLFLVASARGGRQHPAEEVISTARSGKEAARLGALARFLERYK